MARFNAHIIASGDIETKRVFIGNASGLTNIPAAQLVGTVSSGNLPAEVVFQNELLDASGYLQGQINAVSAGSVMSVSGFNGGSGLAGHVVVSGLGATVFTSGGYLVIEPDVRRAELLFSSPVNAAVLTHNWGARPLVQVFDLNDDQVFGDVSHNSIHEVQVDFLETQTGRLVIVG
ncbi:MAG: hypothetical protein MN733_42030 [Nitrososphaera sp.]|nr:hypothetical protein [Nitrososphaera sp.]